MKTNKTTKFSLITEFRFQMNLIHWFVCFVKIAFVKELFDSSFLLQFPREEKSLFFCSEMNFGQLLHSNIRMEIGMGKNVDTVIQSGCKFYLILSL